MPIGGYQRPDRDRRAALEHDQRRLPVARGRGAAAHALGTWRLRVGGRGVLQRQPRALARAARDGHRARGRARVAHSSTDVNNFNPGEILVAPNTNADFVEAIRKSSGIITEEESLTSHAAIIGLSVGVHVIVGVNNATRTIRDGDILTMDIQRGLVYSGAVGTP